MITRTAFTEIWQALQQFPAVTILGPRQIGKTTLAYEIGNQFPNSIYLDLETPSDLAKLQDAELYFANQPEGLIILDEIQRAPNLFQILRGVIDRRRREGQRNSQFLLLGSASLDLLQQTSESLAGRIKYIELSGLTSTEVIAAKQQDGDKLWLRGGFPDSFLATSDQQSLSWRLAFIKTYLERDIPQLGPRIPATTLQRFWTMLAHNQASLLNANNLARALAVSVPTISRYLDLLVDLLLVRRLQPWTVNLGKRLVKTPKVYIRDSGLAHALLNIASLDELLGHPVAGASWEGYIIENLLAVLQDGQSAWFYRTAAGAEIDLVLELGVNKRVAIEIKRSLTPTISKGFYNGCVDIQATHCYVVYAGKERYFLNKDVEAMSLQTLTRELKLISHGNAII